MRRLFRVLLTTACLPLGCAAVAGAGQPSPKPPANEDCLACHSDPDAKRANGTLVAVDAPAFAASKHGPMACVDCHADLATLTEFPHPDTLKKVNCASCHDDIGATYATASTRGRGKSGRMSRPPAPTATAVTTSAARPTEPRARGCWRRGVCHDGSSAATTGVHAAALKKGDARAPSVPIVMRRTRSSVWTPTPRLHATAGAARVIVGRRVVHPHVPRQSHAARLRHAAACANCHGAHDILRRRTPTPPCRRRICGPRAQVSRGRQRALRPARPASEPARLQTERDALVGEPRYWVLIRAASHSSGSTACCGSGDRSRMPAHRGRGPMTNRAGYAVDRPGAAARARGAAACRAHPSLRSEDAADAHRDHGDVPRPLRDRTAAALQRRAVEPAARDALRRLSWRGAGAPVLRCDAARRRCLPPCEHLLAGVHARRRGLFWGHVDGAAASRRMQLAQQIRWFSRGRNRASSSAIGRVRLLSVLWHNADKRSRPDALVSAGRFACAAWLDVQRRPLRARRRGIAISFIFVIHFFNGPCARQIPDGPRHLHGVGDRCRPS